MKVPPTIAMLTKRHNYHVHLHTHVHLDVCVMYVHLEVTCNCFGNLQSISMAKLAAIAVAPRVDIALYRQRQVVLAVRVRGQANYLLVRQTLNRLQRLQQMMYVQQSYVNGTQGK